MCCLGCALPCLHESYWVMKKDKKRVWKRAGANQVLSSKPDFYLTDKEKKDGESSRIQRWLVLADRLFDNDDSDATPSAA